MFGLACFWLSPSLKGVTPTPDGCYPNFTTAEGCDALNVLTTGAGNTALGWRSLFLDTTGNFNTGVGGGALALNNGDSNTAVGAAALLLNTTGTQNVAVGDNALENCTDGNSNVAVGKNAGNNVHSGSGGIYIGPNAQGPFDEGDVVRIGDSSVTNYDTFIVGISGRGVDVVTAAPVYADANQKIGTVPMDRNGNRVPFKPQAMLDESLRQQKRIENWKPRSSDNKKGWKCCQPSSRSRQRDSRHSSKSRQRKSRK